MTQPYHAEFFDVFVDPAAHALVLETGGFEDEFGEPWLIRVDLSEPVFNALVERRRRIVAKRQERSL